jgi:hypothetical protein
MAEAGGSTLSDFRRLYRELCKDADGLERDNLLYTKEREEAMYRLGHDVKGFRKNVSPSKHHGSVARLRVIENPEEKCKLDRAQRRRDQEVRQAIRKNDEFNAMIGKMKTTVLDQGQTMDDNFIDALSKTVGLPNGARRKREARGGGSSSSASSGSIRGGARALATHSAGSGAGAGSGRGLVGVRDRATTRAFDDFASAASRITTSTSSTKGDYIHHTFLPRTQSLVRHDHKVSKQFTPASWPIEEREAINRIYWALERPRDRHLSAWKVYYRAFADRFCELFPKRNPTEVMEKVQSMIQTRQLKEKGETDYWQAQLGSKAKGAMNTTQTSSLPQGERFKEFKRDW